MSMIFHAKNIMDFFIANVPSWKTLAVGGPMTILWATICLMFAGYLKRRWKWKTGYTRKVFHSLIFGSVVCVNWRWGTPGVCLFGAMTTLVIAFALLKGRGNFMYEAMAREKDEPHRSHYIIVPYFATLVGGVLSNIFFPQYVVFGYLVAGLGDAIAEPVGTRFGKHQYKVPAISGVKAVRSLEGSSAVLIMSVVSLILCLAISTQYELSWQSLFVVLFIAILSTLVEAVSPHGWDNATMQVVPAMLGSMLL